MIHPRKVSRVSSGSLWSVALVLSSKSSVSSHSDSLLLSPPLVSNSLSNSDILVGSYLFSHPQCTSVTKRFRSAIPNVHYSAGPLFRTYAILTLISNPTWIVDVQNSGPSEYWACIDKMATVFSASIFQLVSSHHKTFLCFTDRDTFCGQSHKVVRTLHESWAD